MDLNYPKVIRRPYCDGDLYVKKFDKVSGLLEVTSSSGTFFAFANEKFVEVVPKSKGWISVLNSTLDLDSISSGEEHTSPSFHKSHISEENSNPQESMGNSTSSSPEEGVQVPESESIGSEYKEGSEHLMIQKYLGVDSFSRGEKLSFSSSVSSSSPSSPLLQSILKSPNSHSPYEESQNPLPSAKTANDAVNTSILSALPTKRKKSVKAVDDLEQKRIKWGVVQIREHKRAIGGSSAIPSYTQPDWMLGLSDTVVIRHFTPIESDSKSKAKDQIEETWEEIDMSTRMGFSPSLIPDTSEQETFHIEDHIVRGAEFGLAAFGISRQKGNTPSPFVKAMSSPRGPKGRKGPKGTTSTPSLGAGGGDLSALDSFDLGQAALSSTETERCVEVAPIRFRRRTTTHGIITVGTVDEYEAWRQKELENRMSMLPEKDRKKCTGENRQFSHKSFHNPLFDVILPRSRAEMLARDIGDIYETSMIKRNLAQAEACEFIQSSRKNSGCSCQISKESDFRKDTLITVRQKALSRGLSEEGTKAEIVARIIQHASVTKICGADSSTPVTPRCNDTVSPSAGAESNETEAMGEARTSPEVLQNPNLIPDKLSMGPLPYGTQFPREKGPEVAHHFLLRNELAHDRGLYLEREVNEEHYDFFYKLAHDTFRAKVPASEQSAEKSLSSATHDTSVTVAHRSAGSSTQDTHSRGPQCVCVIEGIGCHYETCKCRDADCKNRWKYHCTAYTYDLQGVKDFVALIMRLSKTEEEFFFDEAQTLDVYNSLEVMWQERRDQIARAAFEKAERARLEAERIVREAEEKRLREEEEQRQRKENERLERLAAEQAKLEAEERRKREEERLQLEMEQERLEKQRLEKERLEALRLEKECIEKARLEKENKLNSKSKRAKVKSNAVRDDEETTTAPIATTKDTTVRQSRQKSNLEQGDTTNVSALVSVQHTGNDSVARNSREKGKSIRGEKSGSKSRKGLDGRVIREVLSKDKSDPPKTDFASAGVRNPTNTNTQITSPPANSPSSRRNQQRKRGEKSNVDGMTSEIDIFLETMYDIPVLEKQSGASQRDQAAEREDKLPLPVTPVKDTPRVVEVKTYTDGDVTRILGFEPLFKNIANFRFCTFPPEIFSSKFLSLVTSMMKSNSPRYTVFDISSRIAQEVGEENLRLFFQILKDEAASNRKKSTTTAANSNIPVETISESPAMEKTQKNVPIKSLPKLVIVKGEGGASNAPSPRSSPKKNRSARSPRAKQDPVSNPSTPISASKVTASRASSPRTQTSSQSGTNRSETSRRLRKGDPKKRSVEVSQ